MNKTTYIENKVRNIAKNFNIEIESMDVLFVPSYTYKSSLVEETTNETYEVNIIAKNTETLSSNTVHEFYANVMKECSEDWKYDTFVDIENFEED